MSKESLFTLQINSVQALDRLLGGDTVSTISLVRMPVRRASAKAAAALWRRLASKVRQPVQEAVSAATAKAYEEQLAWDRSHRRFFLHPSVMEAIKESVQKGMDEVVEQAINKAVATALEERLPKILLRVEKVMREKVDTDVNARYNASIKELVDAGVKERLRGLLA